jgi:hypothetical protein
MAESMCWREQYRAAMLVLDPTRVRESARAARAAIARRWLELERDGCETLEEGWELSDAAGNLKFWEKLNSRPPIQSFQQGDDVSH